MFYYSLLALCASSYIILYSTYALFTLQRTQKIMKTVKNLGLMLKRYNRFESLFYRQVIKKQIFEYTMVQIQKYLYVIGVDIYSRELLLDTNCDM